MPKAVKNPKTSSEKKGIEKSTKPVKKTRPVKKTAVPKEVETFEVEAAPTPVAPASSRMNPRNTVALMAVLVILASLGYLYYRFWNVATVNGKPISRLEYYQAMEKQVGKQTLENLVTETLIKDTAAKQGVKVDQKTIDQSIADIENQIKSQGQTLDDALAQEGMTKADLEYQIRLQKLVETMAATSSAVTDTEINNYLNTNKAQLPTGETQEQLREFAKTQLEKQAQSDAIRAWLAHVRAQAQIVYH